MNTKILAVVATLMIVCGCAPKSDLDAANQKIAELQAQVETLKSALTLVQSENGKLRAELSKKPELPVTLGLRKAVMGPGYVAVFNTTVKNPVSVLAIVKSSALGTVKQFELQLNPSAPTELGHMEGATIDLGDTITLENKNYTSVSFTVGP